ncbi:hypothetical protein SAMN05421858_3892 [Haladaptatus litoreus]|uniref:DUF35 domain-containing protein n=1 Tax=Haladaptatus litoreus TaxID=553468 RepID=A0A1N7DZY6_9EURY|nr:hypothetical protein [Haladaptatus litoreus]SIR81368.1 hypothetical protein SAMN05421858_3892 [Haladaptatus litoreus]
MGLFKNLGRKVEEFKKTSESIAAEEAKYECENCEKRFYVEKSECPECGGNVVSRDDESDSASSDEEQTEPRDD